MSITAAMVKELRERSGAGMMECKKALIVSNGDIEEAMSEMRKAGQAKADKKAGRTAAEGIITIKLTDDAKKAVMIEINSETDFVARDESFNTFAKLVSDTALLIGTNSIETLAISKIQNSDDTVEAQRLALIAKIGENIKVRRIECMESDGVIGHYVHSSKIGVLVNLKGGNITLAKDIAMHIAASRPLVVKREQVSDDTVNKEREIFTAQAQESGKPVEIIEKMIGGRINKFLDEVSLLGQPFVKDPNQKVEQLLKSNQAEVLHFVRFEVGEGIEKKEDNFVEEVLAQVRES